MLKPDAACSSKPVSLFLAGHIFLLKRLDPSIPEKAVNGAVQRPGTQPDLLPAQLFDIFQEGVPVPGLTRQAREDQQHWPGKRFHLRSHMSSHDMSYEAILHCGDVFSKSRCGT